MSNNELFWFAKFEKGSDRLVGYLSRGKRRWLPEVSKHQHLQLTASERAGIEQQYKSRYGWQETYNYYFKTVPKP